MPGVKQCWRVAVPVVAGALVMALLASGACARVARWHLTGVHRGEGTPSGLSCASSSSCMITAVHDRDGAETHPFSVLVRNGRTSRPSGLKLGGGVSCRKTRCVAVGMSNYEPAIQVLRRFWSSPVVLWTGPSPSGFHGVSCATDSTCYSVGSVNEIDPGCSPSYTEYCDSSLPLIGLWTPSEPRLPSGYSLPSDTDYVSYDLDAISCPSSSSCVAVGQWGTDQPDHLFAYVGHGDHWKVEHLPIPRGAASATLQSVSCSSATRCTAVGSYQGAAPWFGSAGTILRPFAERRTNGHWRLIDRSLPAGSTAGELESVACPRHGACVAVGYVQPGGRGSQPGGRDLAESWNGRSWTRMSTPSPRRAARETAHGRSPYLTEVSCPTAGFCEAVGNVGLGWFTETLHR